MDRRSGTAALKSARAGQDDADNFGAGEVLLDGVRAWLTQLPAYAGVALLIHVPLFALLFLPELPGWIVVAIFIAAELVAALLVKAALVKAVLDAQRGLSSEFRELLEALNRNAPAVLGMGMRILFRAAARMPKLLLPGVVYLCETFAAVPEVIAGDAAPSAALRRSEELIEGARLPVFGVCAAIWALAGTLPFVFGIQHGAYVITMTWMIVYLCTRALDTSLAAVLSATTYFHLLQRPQAFDARSGRGPRHSGPVR